MPPFLLGESYGDARMGLARILGLCAALLFASSVNAAVTIDLGPSDYRSWGSGSFQHHPNGINSKFGQTVRIPPASTALTVTRNPVIPYGSVVNGMRGMVRVSPQSLAASAAITALMLGLDWAFDDEMDAWMRYGENEVLPPDPNSYRWIDISSPSTLYADPLAACTTTLPYTSDTGWYHGFESMNFTSETRVQCMGPRGAPGAAPSGSWPNATFNRIGTSCPEGAFYDPDRRGCVTPGALIPLTESDWADMENYLPTANPDLVGSAAGHSQRRLGNPLPGYTDTTIEGPASVSGPETTSTSTDPVTGDSTVTNTSTQTYINYGDTTITTTNTTTSTTYQNGQQTGETVTTETPGELPVESGGGASGDWPGFCEWASVVCDWFNWTQEEPPPEQDLPSVIDDDFYQEKNISFGAKSCPPDHQINLAPFLPNPVAVSFQPLCDFAGLIYFMVMAASYIIAAYITIGVARNG